MSKFKGNTMENIENLRKILDGGNFAEILKPSIKTKSNENVKKQISYIKDKPETWFDCLSVAIFHQNFEIVECMIREFGITPRQVPLINALTFAYNIQSENTKIKQNENKDSYQEIECPLIIQSAIGGNIEIFKYLQSKGFCDFNATGHIALSKKQRNSVISNVVGAAAYYGRDKFLSYLIENYEKKINLNFFSLERKAKIKHGSLIKEASGLTPIALTITSDISQSDSIRVMKTLDKAKVNLTEGDCKGNNMLHLATKNNKLEVVKFIIEDLDLGDLSKKTNKDGQTAIAIAEEDGCEAICDYLKNNTEHVDANLEQELKELMESKTSKGKKKKGKKKKEDDIGFLNSGDYQETLKIEPTEEKKKVEKVEEEEVEEENEEEESGAQKKGYYRDNNYYNRKGGYYNNNNNNNYNRGGRYYNNNYDYDNYDNYNSYNTYDGGNGYYDNRNYKDSSGRYYKKNNYRQGNNYSNRNPKFTEKEVTVEPQQTQTATENTVEAKKEEPEPESEQVIVGLSKKSKKQRKAEKKKKKEEKREEKIISDEIAKVAKNPELRKEIKDIEDEAQAEQEVKEAVEEAVVEQIVENEIKEKIAEEAVKEAIVEEAVKEAVVNEIIKDEIKNELEEEESDENSEDDFLRENESAQKEAEVIEEMKVINKEIKKVESLQKEMDNLETKIENTELLEKYSLLEKKYESLQKEKVELENLLRATLLTKTTIPSTEENINDLLQLANSEIKEKDKIIFELQRQLESTELRNIENLPLQRLKALQEQYESNLKQIAEAINNKE